VKKIARKIKLLNVWGEIIIKDAAVRRFFQSKLANMAEWKHPWKPRFAQDFWGFVHGTVGYCKH
jgi:hypothetical protein